jgi:hypothetical protein
MSKKNKDIPFVILTFASNTCYPSLVTELKGTIVDFENKTWSFEGNTYKFTQKRYIRNGCIYGPISVYDKSDIKHLETMLFAWGSQKSTSNFGFDD